MENPDPNTSPPEKAARRKAPAAKNPLSQEIRLVRLLIREAKYKVDEADSLDELLKTLKTVSEASEHLARILKANRELSQSDSVGDDTPTAIQELTAELKEKGIESILTSGLG
jgi:hypothetical protein